MPLCRTEHSEDEVIANPNRSPSSTPMMLPKIPAGPWQRGPRGTTLYILRRHLVPAHPPPDRPTQHPCSNWKSYT